MSEETSVLSFGALACSLIVVVGFVAYRIGDLAGKAQGYGLGFSAGYRMGQREASVPVPAILTPGKPEEP